MESTGGYPPTGEGDDAEKSKEDEKHDKAGQDGNGLPVKHGMTPDDINHEEARQNASESNQAADCLDEAAEEHLGFEGGVGDGAEVGLADVVGVFGEDAAREDGGAALEGFAAAGEFAGGDFEIELMGEGVDGDGVAIFHEGERAAEVGLGRDVADDEAARAAGEATVGDERDVVAEAAAHDGAGGGEHFAHAGSAFGPFVADDDDVTLFDFVGEDGLERGFLGIEDAGFAVNFSPSLPEIFATPPSGARLPYMMTRWLSGLMG